MLLRLNFACRSPLLIITLIMRKCLYITSIYFFWSLQGEHKKNCLHSEHLPFVVLWRFYFLFRVAFISVFFKKSALLNICTRNNHQIYALRSSFVIFKGRIENSPSLWLLCSMICWDLFHCKRNVNFRRELLTETEA